MRIIYTGLLGCALAYLPVTGFSACDKKDIEFYLDKGFNQEQITQLCAASETSVPDYQPYQQQVIIYSEEEGPKVRGGFTREERKAIQELQQGLDVVGFVADQESLQFTVRICLAVQEGKEYSQRFKTCPEVFYKILRSGLTVVASGKQLGFLGQNTLIITGNMKITPKQDFDDYPAQFRKQLKRNFDWKIGGDKAKVPVHPDFPVPKMVAALNTLAKPDDPNANMALLNEAADETADEPAKEGEASVDDKPEKKKKKRWWNPFD